MRRMAERGQQELLAVMEACHADLDAWRERSQSIEVPQPGSAMEADDEAWSPHPLSVAAWGALLSAADHLQTVRVHVEQVDIHPYATFSVCRGALLSAAQAAWVLSSDESGLRRARGMAPAAEFYCNWQDWAKEEAPHLPDAVDREAIAKVRIQTHLRVLGLAIASAPYPVVGRKARSATSIVRTAAAAVFPDRPDLQRAVVSNWRTSSSDVHGFGWGALTRGPALTGNSGHLGAFEIGGNLRATVEHFKAGWLLSQWAWRRWDVLMAAPTP
jgi:hypothetical protein